MKSFDYVIKDELGLHARPAGLLAKEVKNYESTITIAKGGKTVPAKGVMSIMSLAVKAGDTVTITAEGADEDKAAEGLLAFLTANV